MKHLNIFIHFWTYLPAWITKHPTKIELKTFFVAKLLFSFLLNQTRALEKQQRDTLLSDRLEIEGLGVYFAKKPHRPQVTNSLVYIEVIKFCGSQPCSPSREQRFYGLIELEPRTSVRKLFNILHKWEFYRILCNNLWISPGYSWKNTEAFHSAFYKASIETSVVRLELLSEIFIFCRIFFRK